MLAFCFVGSVSTYYKSPFVSQSIKGQIRNIKVTIMSNKCAFFL